MHDKPPLRERSCDGSDLNLSHGGRYRDRTYGLGNVNAALIPTELTALNYVFMYFTISSLIAKMRL